MAAFRHSLSPTAKTSDSDDYMVPVAPDDSELTTDSFEIIDTLLVIWTFFPVSEHGTSIALRY